MVGLNLNVNFFIWKTLGVGLGSKEQITIATGSIFEDNLRTKNYFKNATKIAVYNVPLRLAPYIKYPWQERQPLLCRYRREEPPMSAEP